MYTLKNVQTPTILFSLAYIKRQRSFSNFFQITKKTYFSHFLQEEKTQLFLIIKNSIHLRKKYQVFKSHINTLTINIEFLKYFFKFQQNNNFKNFLQHPVRNI